MVSPSISRLYNLLSPSHHSLLVAMNGLARVSALAALVAGVWGNYHNGAPLLVSSFEGYADGALAGESAKGLGEYMMSAADASARVSALTGESCAEDNTLFVRVHGLTNSDLSEAFLGVFGNPMKVVANNVIYPVGDEDATLELNSACEMITVPVIEDEETWLEKATEFAGSQRVELTLDNALDRLDKLAVLHSEKNVVLQGVPDAGAGGAGLTQSTTQISVENLERAIREAFEEVEELIDEKTHGKEPEKIVQEAQDFVAPVGGLFARYTFFTPGIWMGTIVSLLLVLLVSAALSWLSSMQISYRAFDKPVDFEKKFQ